MKHNMKHNMQNEMKHKLHQHKMPKHDNYARHAACGDLWSA